MKKLVVTALIVLSNYSFSQKIKDYTWSEKPLFNEIPEQFRSAPAVVLKDNREIYIRVGYYAFASFIVRHEAIKINKASAINDYNKVKAVNGLTRSVRDFHARIIKPDGKIVVLSEDKITETEVGKVKSLVFEGVQEGDIIEYYYILKEVPQSNDVEIIQREIPILESKMEFSASGVGFNILTTGNLERIENDGRTTIIGKNIPAYKDESNNKKVANLYKIIYQAYTKGVANSNTWDTFFTNALGKFKGTQISKGKSKNFVKDLNLNDASKTIDQRITALDLYIKSNFEIKERGDATKLKKDLSEGKQKVTYSEMLSLVAMALTEMKIHFQVIATMDRFLGDLDKKDVYFSFPFTYEIYIPKTKKFIAPFEDFVNYGFPTWEVQKTTGIIYDCQVGERPKCSFETLDIPFTPADFTTTKTQIALKLTPDQQNVSIEKSTATSGYAGQINRGNIREIKAIDDKIQLEKYVNYVCLEGVEAKLLEYSFDNEAIENNYTNTPFIFKCKAETKTDFIETAGNLLLVNLGKSIGTQSNLYQETTRENPVELQYAKKYEHQITFEIPTNYEIESFKDFIVNKTFFKDKVLICSFISAAKIDNTKLVIDVTETYNDITYDLKEYNSYRDVINASADFTKAAVVLKPKN